MTRRYVTIPVPELDAQVDTAAMLTAAAARLRDEHQLSLYAMASAVAEILDSTAAALAAPSEGGTTVTATDGSSSESHHVVNNYAITTDGTAYVHGIQLHRRADGTTTHVITVRGCRR